MANLVFVITRADTIGGAHIHVKDLAKELTKHGVKVTVMVGGRGPFTRLLADESVSVLSLRQLDRSIKPLRDMLAFRELRAEIRRMNPDLVVLHSSKAGLLGRLATSTLKIPSSFTVHGWSFTEGIGSVRAKVFHAIEAATARFTDKVIVVSSYDKQLARRKRVVGDDRMEVVHNGIHDDPSFRRAIPDRNPVKLIMVARMDHQKDHLVLIETLRNMKDLEWNLDLVGDGPQRPTIEDRISEVGLSQRVRVLGLRTDVHDLLAQAQVFVLTSHWEGFPLTTLEAMRAGLPVVVSDVGGAAEAIVHGRTGLTVVRNDIGSLSEALRKLITNSELRSTMGFEGRRHFEKHFTFKRMFRKTVKVYKDVLTEKGCVDASEKMTSILEDE